jgi:acyl dehydratase
MARQFDRTPGSGLQGAKFAFEFAIDWATMMAFADISGDRHPLHLERDYAISRGHEGPVVYGGLLVAQVSRLIGAEMAVAHCVWSSLRVDFRSPLYQGQTALLTAEVVVFSEAVNAAKLKFVIATADRVIATGSVDVMIYD